jgi:hypothetical protein
MSAIGLRCSVLSCPAVPQAEQRIAKFPVVLTHGSECHRQRLDTLLRRVKLSAWGVARQSDPYWLFQGKEEWQCIS